MVGPHFTNQTVKREKNTKQNILFHWCNTSKFFFGQVSTHYLIGSLRTLEIIWTFISIFIILPLWYFCTFHIIGSSHPARGYILYINHLRYLCAELESLDGQTLMFLRRQWERCLLGPSEKSCLLLSCAQPL